MLRLSASQLDSKAWDYLVVTTFKIDSLWNAVEDFSVVPGYEYLFQPE